MSQHLRCQVCGGSVVYNIDVTGAACLFCGAVALAAVPEEEVIPTPDTALVSTLDRVQADSAYRAWARRSWFYPNVLRNLEVELRPMMLPAWRFAGEVETHWAGVTRARTRSGTRPISGHERRALQYMVPASGGLEEAELAALQPFDENAANAWDPAQERLPWEPPALSESSARVRAHKVMAAHHQHDIEHEHNLSHCRISPVVHDRDVALFVLPVYIGAFRFRDRAWRFVINAQTGVVAGKAPIDRLKVAVLILAGIAVAVMIGLIAVNR